MKINFNSTKFYFLTIDDEKFKYKSDHIFEIFKDYDISEVNPLYSENISKNKSGSIGFGRMIDKGLLEQNRKEPFQPFVLLEDDVSIYRDFTDIEIPDDTDLLYIGLSPWGMPFGEIGANFIIIYDDIDENLFKNYNMCSTHGIIICSARGASTYQKSVVESFYMDLTWDIILSKNISYINTYALKTPLVYQDSKYGGIETTKLTFNELRKVKFTPLIEEENIMTVKSFSQSLGYQKL